MALQCAIPVFDGLFKPHNNAIVMDLLFELTTLHALAKLRLHTESTICALETSTTRLGIALRKFQSTICAEFETRDLPSEEAARGRRKAAKAKAKPVSLKGKGKETEAKVKPASSKGKGKEMEAKAKPASSKGKGKETEAPMGKRKKKSTLRFFSLSCYKPHSLGDYAKTIRLFGTSDGYSTQIVCILKYCPPIY